MIYAVVQLTVTNTDTFANYAKQAGAALAKYGAQPVAMTTEPTVIEGDKPAPGRAVLLSFPDKDAAMGWINDPDFAEIHGLRRSSGTSDILLLA